MIKEKLKRLVGNVPKDANSFKQRMRLHQGWWRAFILGEEQGEHPQNKEKRICNTILNGEKTEKNFLTNNTKLVVRDALQEWESRQTGEIEQNRLYNNLLSSQPLCFNFFGELKKNKELALLVLRRYVPYITAVNGVYFEYAPTPTENYTGDNSAFDVAFMVSCEDQQGLIGLECKYTDEFTYKPGGSKIFYGDTGNKNHDKYLEIYNKSAPHFLADYYEYVQDKRFNQLFRNELIGQSLLQHGDYNFVVTGVFCHQDDSYAIECAKSFQEKIKDHDQGFKIITYSNYIENLQQLDLDWATREWTMLLWARYCALQLSQEVL